MSIRQSISSKLRGAAYVIRDKRGWVVSTVFDADTAYTKAGKLKGSVEVVPNTITETAIAILEGNQR